MNDLASKPQTWEERIPVWNGSNYQHELAKVRKYKIGSVFVDRLWYGDKVFETRKRTVILDDYRPFWESKIVYQDPASFPPGYVPISVNACNACHNQTATGNYAGPLVPGGDTVLSDPLFVE